MGLDTTHGCWHGAYSAFMRWRKELARVAGIPLMLMDGFHKCPPEADMRRARAWREAPLGSGEKFDLLAAWALEVDDLLPLSWDLFRGDPIVTLLNHSDCDGEIAASDCAPLADRLASLLPLLPDEDAGGHIGNWRAKTQTFIDGLRLAAAAGEPVGFH